MKLKTLKKWNELGYMVKAGEKSTLRSRSGQALFSENQVTHKDRVTHKDQVTPSSRIGKEILLIAAEVGVGKSMLSYEDEKELDNLHNLNGW